MIIRNIRKSETPAGKGLAVLDFNQGDAEEDAYISKAFKDDTAVKKAVQ